MVYDKWFVCFSSNQCHSSFENHLDPVTQIFHASSISNLNCRETKLEPILLDIAHIFFFQWCSRVYRVSLNFHAIISELTRKYWVEFHIDVGYIDHEKKTLSRLSSWLVKVSSTGQQIKFHSFSDCPRLAESCKLLPSFFSRILHHFCRARPSGGGYRFFFHYRPVTGCVFFPRNVIAAGANSCWVCRVFTEFFFLYRVVPDMGKEVRLAFFFQSRELGPSIWSISCFFSNSILPSLTLVDHISP